VEPGSPSENAIKQRERERSLIPSKRDSLCSGDRFPPALQISRTGTVAAARRYRRAANKVDCVPDSFVCNVIAVGNKIVFVNFLQSTY
jgi:hypothetical protein